MYYVRTYVCMYVCMYVCIMYVRMYVCMYVGMYACMNACMYVCMHACMYVYTMICIRCFQLQDALYEVFGVKIVISTYDRLSTFASFRHC
jgi:hypothetical protein